MTGKPGFKAVALAAMLGATPAAAQPPPAPGGQQEPAAVRPEETEPARVAPAASVAPRGPLTTRLGVSATWDSNVFRLPDGEGDRIATAWVGMHLDQPYAQQRFLLDVTQTAYRYDTFSHLNFDALQYRGAWAWHLGPRVSGTLAAERSESLVSYADFRATTARNVRTAEARHLNADAWLFGAWHLLGGVRFVETRYSVPFPEEGNLRGTGIEAGVRSQLRSGSSLTLNVRSLDATYEDRTLDPVALLDDGFRRAESEALATWVLTAKTSAHGRVAHVEHRSNHFGARDFTDTEARIGATWAAAARLALQISVSREVQPWSDDTASYRVNKQVVFGPDWQAGPRTLLRVSAVRAQSDFRGAVPGFAAAPRRDLLRTLQLAATWSPLRYLALNTTLQRQRQSSTEAGSTYRASVATLGASLAF